MPDENEPNDPDWVLDTTARAIRYGSAVYTGVARGVGYAEHVREMREAGATALEVVDFILGTRPLRSQIEADFAAYSAALRDMRVGMIRELVDAGGLSLTAAGKRMGVSRQVATRLYHGQD